MKHGAVRGNNAGAIRLVMALAFVLVSAFAVPAQAEPIRIVVAAGHRYGTPDERPLRYARDDAARVSAVFTEMGGVRKELAFIADEPTAYDLSRALERAAQAAATHRPEEVTFILYFSGHGDRERLHLGAESYALTDLGARIARIPAGLRIVVLDACRTDDTLRPKGMAAEPAFAVALDNGGVATGVGSGAATGTVWIHASAEGDPAQESQELAGGVFTHYWISGLRGAADADGDRRVTLAESYDYAYHQTLFKSARAAGVLQRPTARLDLREAGPIVLTVPTPASSRLLLPQVADSQFLVYEPRSRHVLAEAWSLPDRRVAIGLPPGSYVVQRRAGGNGGAAEIALARGEEKSLAPSDFRDVPLETLARKGGDVILTPHEIELGYLPAAQVDFGLVQRAGVKYMHRLGGAAVGVGVHGGVGATDTPAQHVAETSAGGSVRLEWRGTAGAITLRAGGGPAVEWIEQRLVRHDAERVAAASYATTDKKHAIGVGPLVTFGAAWAFAKPVFASLGGEGSALLVPSTTGTLVRWTGGASVGAGLSF